MLSPLRNRFGIPGVISVIALVFAMLGGAYAASNNSAGKATASAKGKQGPRGKTGKTGPAGPAGSQGPAGANGAKGDAGAKGDTGNTGSPGAPGAVGDDGKSVEEPVAFTGEEEEPENEGPCQGAGGIEVLLEDSTEIHYVCNGEPGKASEVLAPGDTETGAWGFNGSEDDTFGIFVPITFQVPLAANLNASHVHFQTEPGFAGTCTGNTIAPIAPSGTLCVYESSALLHVNFLEFHPLDGSEGALNTSRMGTVMYFEVTGDPAFGFGSWALTG